MKMRRLAIVLALMIAFLFSMAASASAAGNKDVIQALKDAKVPEFYIIHAENFLKTRELTSEEAEYLIELIQRCYDIMKKAGTRYVTKLPLESKLEIVSIVKEGGRSIGLDVTLIKNSDGSWNVIGVEEGSGKETFHFTTNVVRQTGVDYTVLYLGAALILIAIASVVIIKSRISEPEAA